MAFGYPVLLELAGRRAVVIGEFAVEAGKVEGLLAAGAEVTVVAKGPQAALDRLDGDPRVVVHRRGYGGPGDLAGAVVCVASAAKPAVRDAIAADARAAGVLVNVMDDVPNCDFAAPAIVRRGDLLIAIGTGGRAPALAGRLRADGRGRPGAGRHAPPPARLRGPLPPLEGRPRPGRARAPDPGGPRRGGRHPPPHPPAGGPAHGGVVSGTVYLVGAGPGDPRLLTLRGAEVLQRADVVVYDRLAPEALLDLAPRGAERVDAGKARGRVALSQEAINRVLVDRGRRGLTVVRLKGGDPFVFGRGGEEALALAEAGVPFEVVPGVSAAVAAPAYAGIPVTHRGLAASYAVISATLAGGAPADLVRTAAAADTLVLLMAAERLGEVCAQLIAAGRPADEPAAVVASASTAAQQVVTGTLAGLAAADPDVDPPATLVCGPSVALADRLAWFAHGEHAGILPAAATQP
jgi:uroporphyrin-III C-methyltransferase/precorrin-2 dehydrogenase/sirohydrochlorin ferrochelatase